MAKTFESHGDILCRQFQQQDLETVQRLFKQGFSTQKVIWDRELYIQDILTKDLSDVQKYYLDVNGGNFFVAEFVPHQGETDVSRVVGCVGVLSLNEPISVNSGLGVPKDEEDSPAVDQHQDAVAQREGPQNRVDHQSCGDGFTFEMKRLFVDSEFHGKGGAQLLLGVVEKYVFQEQHGESIALSTGSDLRRACRFYEKMGYELMRVDQVQLAQFYPAVPSDLVLPVNFYVKKKK